MNLKKRIRGFFTLTRKSDGGFTLVELIVVIAILAILSGVAVPAYSGYVKKANMQADISLAREIEQALMLAHYNGKLEDGATVIVTTDDVTVAENTGADEAMAAAFGSGYADTVRLKYDGWAEEMTTLLTPGAIANVQDSTFKGEALGYLLDDVQMVVGALGNFLEGKEVPDALLTYMKENGLTTGDAVTAGNKNMVSNMATLYVADNLGNIDSDAFAQKWNGAAYEALRAGAAGEDVNHDAYNFGTLTSETLAQGAASYARVEALANYVDAKNGNSNFYSMMPKDPAQFQDISGLASLQSLLDEVEGQILATEFSAYCDYFGITASEGNTIPAMFDPDADYDYLIFPEQGTATQASKDSKAFLSYMGGLSESADSLAGNTDLNSGAYFNDGTIQQYVENYMAIGEALANGSYPNGAFMFIYKNGAVNCAPLDY